MMKVLDYYYLVLLRWYDYMLKKDKLFYYVPSIMSFTIVLNIISLLILFAPYIIDSFVVFLVICLISNTVIYSILNIIYNTNRREKLRETYKDESPESRQRGIAWVVVYEIFSIVFLIWAVSMSVVPNM